MKLLFHKNVLFAVLILSIIFIVFCFIIDSEDKSKNYESFSQIESSDESFEKLWQSDYLYYEIPAPTSGKVFEFINTSDTKRYHYSFKIEDFSIEDAENYIEFLEKSCIKRQFYEIDNSNDFSILNYYGSINGSIVFSITQCNKTAVIQISVEQE